jgi:hypothetical protein
MKTFIILSLFCGSLYAADTTNSYSPGKHLVEVIFATDDRPTNQMFHTIVTLWISEKNRGSDRWVYSWANQSGYSPDADTEKKAKRCKELLKALDEPKDLPASPNQIVTVRCLYGGETLAKKFPIDRVPYEVHQILTIMGFRDEDFVRLKFIQKQPNMRIGCKI